MIEHCPVCGKPVLGSDCIYCDLKKSLGAFDGIRGSDGRDAPAVHFSEPLNECGPDADEGIGRIAPRIELRYEFEDTVTAYGKDEIVVCRLSAECRDEDADIITTLYIDGEEESVSAVSLIRGEPKVSEISVGCKRFRLEYGADFDMTVEVRASNGAVIGKRTKTIHVRPIFDIRLDELKEDIPLWVTPNAKEIKDLLRPGSGIMDALGRNGYSSISGYQGEDSEDILIKVVIQMKSVYEGLQALGLRYVSDTNSMGNNLTFNYQRVKHPKKVLEERSGNCIELSCLFASVFEAMGLYPVIVFPPGHAMVGVVVSSRRLPDITGLDYSNRRNVIELRMRDCGDGEGDTIQAIILESTCVCGDTSFADALNAASDTMGKNLSRISGKEDYTVLQYERHFKKKRPINW